MKTAKIQSEETEIISTNNFYQPTPLI